MTRFARDNGTHQIKERSGGREPDSKRLLVRRDRTCDTHTDTDVDIEIETRLGMEMKIVSGDRDSQWR